MDAKEFNKEFEDYLIKFTNKFIEDSEMIKKSHFIEESNTIFQFLSNCYLGNMNDKEKVKLFLDNQQIVAKQYLRLLKSLKI